jgi:hypothetical protein
MIFLEINQSETFVSGTVIRRSIIVYPADAWLAALNFVPLNDCVIQTFTIGYHRVFSNFYRECSFRNLVGIILGKSSIKIAHLVSIR